ncbi:MAG: DUF6447 family protein [Lamprobacter sp.]|uniref:hypothetical protein n=1 Tax=Lamprobacter sp. TaxID=3100796 RepID=UPI002B26120F|nr:hypothetical protein [Lamprobacter sp.]MEA3642609.1 DUF6447 family protein [Lamprobacter sp.]
MSASDRHKGGRKVPLSELPELTPWLEQQELKQQLLAQSGGGEAFVALAAPMLKRNLIGVDPRARTRADRGQLKALLRRGFSIDEIARAFAEAWLRDDDTLYLPRRRPSESALVVYGVPLLVLATVFMLTLLGVFQAYPRWLALFVYFAPLLLVPFGPLLWLSVTLWRGFLQGVEQVTRPAPAVVNLTAVEEPTALSGMVLDTQAEQALMPSEPPAVPTDQILEEAAYRVSFEGTDYALADLSDAARQQLADLRLCEQAMQRLQQRLVVYQSVRAVYAQALLEAL